MICREYPTLGEQLWCQELENGLTVRVVKRPGFQKKLAYFITDWGSIHTDFTLEGKRYAMPAGVAHYLEHKLFDMPGGEDISARFAALGASVNAFTSYDVTAYYFGCTTEFAACLELLLRFVSTPWFTRESVQKEQGIIAQEIDMTADSPDNRLFENLMQAMYPEHPIHVPILGTRESIAQITPQVLYDCHRAMYHPGNMILCVVGDVDPEQVCQIARQVLPPDPGPRAQKHTGWPAGLIPARQEISQAMDVAMPMFQLCFACPCPGKGEAGIFQEILGDLAAEALFGESSELYLRLYEQGIIDSSFGGGFETVEGVAMLTCSGDSDSPEAVRQALLEQASLLAREPIEAQTLARMKRSALGRRLRELDSFDSTCFRVCVYHFDEYDYFRFPELYAQVTAEQIRQFIAQVVTPERCCLSVIQEVSHA